MAVFSGCIQSSYPGPPCLQCGPFLSSSQFRKFLPTAGDRTTHTFTDTHSHHCHTHTHLLSGQVDFHPRHSGVTLKEHPLHNFSLTEDNRSYIHLW